MASRVSKSLPLQVAAICYRRRGDAVEFLLVNTNGGNKWTFPKGSPDAHLSHSQAAEREAAEEAGALGTIEPRHFHLYIHSKGVFWQPNGAYEMTEITNGLAGVLPQDTTANINPEDWYFTK